MTQHYITLFDQGFLPNGLALYRSLERYAGDFALWVLCMDERTQEVLERLHLPHLRTVSLKEVETAELVAAKADRTRAEYSWTMTPFTPDVVFERDATAASATYVDADMWLVADPSPIHDELEASGAAVLITEHAYAPEFEQSLSYGVYCVQFMPFLRDGSAEVRRWWQERVVEWCYARPEDGKFGDQKYLDDWTERFGDAVHVLSERQWTQAPWNATRFAARDAVTYHFHRLRTQGGRSALVGLYRLPPDHVEGLYRPYLTDLRWAYDLLATVGFSPQPQSLPGGLLHRGKAWAAFRAHNWPDLRTPYSLRF